MKKYLKYALLVALTVAFTSCKDDDDDHGLIIDGITDTQAHGFIIDVVDQSGNAILKELADDEETRASIYAELVNYSNMPVTLSYHPESRYLPIYPGLYLLWVPDNFLEDYRKENWLNQDADRGHYRLFFVYGEGAYEKDILADVVLHYGDKTVLLQLKRIDGVDEKKTKKRCVDFFVDGVKINTIYSHKIPNVIEDWNGASWNGATYGSYAACVSLQW